jgi:hypothetical protein
VTIAEQIGNDQHTALAIVTGAQLAQASAVGQPTRFRDGLRALAS